MVEMDRLDLSLERKIETKHDNGLLRYQIHMAQCAQWRSIVMQRVDIYTHLKRDCRGFKALL